jgi:hypothetical protein
MALPGADASNLTALTGGGASGRCWVMPAKGEMST